MQKLAALAAAAGLAVAGTAAGSDGSSFGASLTGVRNAHASFAATLTGSKLAWRLTFTGSAASAEVAGTGRPLVLCRPCRQPAKGTVALSAAQAQRLQRGKAIARLLMAGGVLSGKVEPAGRKTVRPPATTTAATTPGGPAGSSWTATAVGLRGQNGNRFEFVCPPNSSAGAGPVWGGGTGYFTDTSAVCPAAVITGDILLQAGGLVIVEILPGQPSYAGTATNGITSQSAGASPGSFVVIHDS